MTAPILCRFPNTPQHTVFCNLGFLFAPDLSNADDAYAMGGGIREAREENLAAIAHLVGHNSASANIMRFTLLRGVQNNPYFPGQSRK